MVRPRFAKLALEQQQAILQAGLDEFAAHGFQHGSLNRVIEVAGISKGSMYYYFDGKEDLYAYVTQTGLERLFAGLGPFPVPSAHDAAAFWSTLEDYYLQLVIALAANPKLAALMRGWITASKNLELLQQAQQEMERAVLPWMEEALAAGQRCGAVRSDLPSALLIAVVFAMGQAMDTWLLIQPPNLEDLPRLISALIDMIRGAVSVAAVD